MNNKVIIYSTIFMLSGCATVNLPNNVTISNKMIDSIDFSYKTNTPKNFYNIKLCVAEIVNNESVDLRDSSNSFIGKYTGNFYFNSQEKTIQGSDIFKYAEDANSTLIAKGTIIQKGFIEDIVKYDLKASVDGNNITLKFYNIVRAQQDTGFIKNSGFDKVCNLSGCRPTNVYEAISSVANKLQSCLS